MLKSDYLLLLKRLGFAFSFFFISRIGFYFYNQSYFAECNLSELTLAFLYGLRFDVATVCITNLFFILLSLIPFRNNYYEIFLKTVFVAFNTAFLWVIFVDYEFFIFLGRKMTFDIFDMAIDIKSQLFQLSFYYWFITLLNIATLGLIIFFYPKRKKIFGDKIKWWQSILIIFLGLIATATAIRGGLQLRSIGPKDAFVHEKFELGNLTINAAYTMARSLGNKSFEKVNYFKTDKEATEVIKKNRNFEQLTSSPGTKNNVVIIIIESLSQEYVDEGFTPFFSELAKDGLYFDKNFANGRRSIEALPSILTGFPSMLEQPLYQTQFQSNRYYPLPDALKNMGYSTAFFHAGKRGTMEFNSYCYSIGIEKYLAMEDYPNQDHFDGNWGIYDHYFFDYFISSLDEMTRPFFAGIFTLSSHQPYNIPSEFQNKFSKGNLEIHESIGYADNSLKSFFEAAKSKPWFNNTLFVITGDHTSKLQSTKFLNLLGSFRVPLLFYHPEIDLTKFQTKRITQQADIMPSVLDFVGVDSKKHLLFGTSVFGKDSGLMINKVSGGHILAKDNLFLEMIGDQEKLYTLNARRNVDELVNDEQKLNEMGDLLKAYIQYTNNGLKGNNIYDL